MVEALKKIDKKILIIVLAIICLPVLLILFLAIIRGCSDSKITYDKYEQKMIFAAKKYFTDEDKNPKKESEVKTVKLSTLVEKEYIKSSEKLLGDDTCSGTVTVRLNGSQVDENKGGILNYIPNLKCDNYKTKVLKDALLDNLTESGSGLYKNDNSYVFVGDQVNNYINFDGTEYRIMGIDSSGFVKLIKSNSEISKEYWDDKYNTETDDLSGKNIYKDSSILKTLLLAYNDKDVIKEDSKKHILSHNVCVDSFDYNSLSGIKNASCNNVVENQLLSIISVDDFAKASLDSECVSVVSNSCINYNYLNDLNLMTWTSNVVSNNTYEVYYLSSGIVNFQKSSKYESYNIVIYIDGNERVTGSGKLNDQFKLVK